MMLIDFMDLWGRMPMPDAMYAGWLSWMAGRRLACIMEGCGLKADTPDALKWSADNIVL